MYSIQACRGVEEKFPGTGDLPVDCALNCQQSRFLLASRSKMTLLSGGNRHFLSRERLSLHGRDRLRSSLKQTASRRPHVHMVYGGSVRQDNLESMINARHIVLTSCRRLNPHSGSISLEMRGRSLESQGWRHDHVSASLASMQSRNDRVFGFWNRYNMSKLYIRYQVSRRGMQECFKN